MISRDFHCRLNIFTLKNSACCMRVANDLDHDQTGTRPTGTGPMSRCVDGTISMPGLYTCCRCGLTEKLSNLFQNSSLKCVTGYKAKLRRNGMDKGVHWIGIRAWVFSLSEKKQSYCPVILIGARD